MKKHVHSCAAVVIALAGLSVAGCRDKSELITSETQTTAVEVERRPAELPITGVALTGAAERATEGAASGALQNEPGTESPTAPGGPSGRLGSDALDANRAPVAGPERTNIESHPDGGH